MDEFERSIISFCVVQRQVDITEIEYIGLKSLSLRYCTDLLQVLEYKLSRSDPDLLYLDSIVGVKTSFMFTLLY